MPFKMAASATDLDEKIHSYYGGPQGMRIPPLFELYRLRALQRQRPEAIYESQRKKLVNTLSQAYGQVRYYKELLDNAGAAPDRIKNAQDLDAIPITERRVFQVRPLKDVTALNADLEKCRRVLTSGSTGRPLMIYRNRREDNQLDMVWAFAFLENGQRLWDKCADFHSYLGIHRRWFERIGVWRRAVIPTLSEPTAQVELLRRLRPDIIRGNPDNIVNVALTIRRKGIQSISPRLIFTMGAVLDRHSRELIESVFGAEVFDYYGSTELGCIAWECSMHKGYHINADSVVVEVLEAQGNRVRPGELGRIVCTGLLAHTMPLIRYYTGDMGVLDERTCPCGRGLPLLSRIEGRAYDFFLLPGGAEISPWTIHNQIKRIEGIEQYRIVQEDLTLINVQLVPGEGWTPQTNQTIHAMLEQITRRTSTINIEIVDSIKEDKSSKIQSIVSRLPRTYPAGRYA